MGVPTNLNQNLQSIDIWLHDLFLILQQDYGHSNWTIEALRVNFSGYFERGITPRKTAESEFGEDLDEKKCRIGHKKR
jgi:hypothetical protein